METLIESMVRVTIRHSDSEPIASEAATVRVSRDEATGPGRVLKPAGPDDRIMAGILQWRANHPQRFQNFAGIAGNIGAAVPRKWQNGGDFACYARYSSGTSAIASRLGGNAGRVLGIGVRAPVHGDETGGLFDPPQP